MKNNKSRKRCRQRQSKAPINFFAQPVVHSMESPAIRPERQRHSAKNYHTMKALVCPATTSGLEGLSHTIAGCSTHPKEIVPEDEAVAGQNALDDAARAPRRFPPGVRVPPQRAIKPLDPTATKVCVKCKEEKPVSEYHKNSRSSDGLHSYCKECNRAQALAHIRAEKARKALLRAARKAAEESS